MKTRKGTSNSRIRFTLLLQAIKLDEGKFARIFLLLFSPARCECQARFLQNFSIFHQDYHSNPGKNLNIKTHKLNSHILTQCTQSNARIIDWQEVDIRNPHKMRCDATLRVFISTEILLLFRDPKEKKTSCTFSLFLNAPFHSIHFLGKPHRNFLLVIFSPLSPTALNFTGNSLSEPPD